MKLAVSSSSYDRALRAGDLTQLEWLDLARDSLDVDGIVCDLEHFPRDDDEYLAQIRKISVDAGLTIAALRDDAFFAPGTSGDTRAAVLASAAALGAPLVLVRAGSAGEIPAASWSELVTLAKGAAGLAKRHNITLAIRNVVGSMTAGPAALRRLQKDVDSTWLRTGIDLAALEERDDAGALLQKAPIACHRTERLAQDGGDPTLANLVSLLEPRRGFLCLDYAAPEPEALAVPGLLRWLRAKTAAATLARYAE